MTELSDRDLKRIRWHTFALGLPREGVKARWPTEEIRRARIAEVRWAQGVRCPKCSGDEITSLATRPVFLCRDCRAQFSVTADTILRRTHLPLGIWFRAVETILRPRGAFTDFDLTSGHWLADQLLVHYLTARRMRNIILTDMEPGGTGFFFSVLCENPITLPASIEENSMEHLMWLRNQVDARR